MRKDGLRSFSLATCSSWLLYASTSRHSWSCWQGRDILTVKYRSYRSATDTGRRKGSWQKAVIFFFNGQRVTPELRFTGYGLTVVFNRPTPSSRSLSFSRLTAANLESSSKKSCPRLKARGTGAHSASQPLPAPLLHVAAGTIAPAAAWKPLCSSLFSPPNLLHLALFCSLTPLRDC